MNLSKHGISLIRHLHQNTQDTAIATCQALQGNYRRAIRYNEQEGNYFQKQRDFTSLHCLRVDRSSGMSRQRVGSPDPVGSWEQLLLSLQGLFLISGMFHVLLPSTRFPNRPTMQPRRGEGEKEPSVQDCRRLYLAQFDPILSNLGHKELRLHWG